MARLCFVALLLQLLVSTSRSLADDAQDKCADPLGMKDNSIPNNAITASSFLSPDHTPSHGRLDFSVGWVAKFNNHKQWIQVDLQSNKKVTGVVIQGIGTFIESFVTSYLVQYSADGHVFQTVQDSSGNTKIFGGTFDWHAHVVGSFEFPVVARYIRINPFSWIGDIIGLRFEVLGCTGEPSIACENSAAVEIACNAGNVINIISANYGRTKPDSEICPGGANNNLECVSTSSFDKVKEICQGKTSCQVNPTNSVFGDPCAGTFKYLLINHTCEPPV